MRVSTISAIPFLLVAVFLVAPIASCDGADSLTDQNSTLMCQAPAIPGCAAEPSFQICGPSGCEDPCSASDIAVTCTGATPDSALGCTSITTPTPFNVLFFCCPCAK
jgi:hypothetical protein